MKKLYLFIFIHAGMLIKNLLDLWYLVLSVTSCASKSTSFRHWSILYIICSVIELKTWSVFFYRKLSVDYESCLRYHNMNSIWRSKGKRATSSNECEVSCRRSRCQSVWRKQFFITSPFRKFGLTMPVCRGQHSRFQP